MKSRNAGSRPATDGAIGRTELAQAVLDCLANPQALGSVARIYEDLDAAVARLGAACRADGACCRFDQAGHLLYLSTAELAYLCQQKPPAHRPGNSLDGRRCPYQADAVCTARRYRTIGCRTFFCGNDLGQALAELYEKSHSAMKAVHQKHCIPYFYVELTSAVAQLVSFL